jgi:hypothetical protein
MRHILTIFPLLCPFYHAVVETGSVVYKLTAQVPRQVPHKKPKQQCQQLAPTYGGQTGGGFQLVGVGGTGTAAGGTATGGLNLGSLLTGR